MNAREDYFQLGNNFLNNYYKSNALLKFFMFLN